MTISEAISISADRRKTTRYTLEQLNEAVSVLSAAGVQKKAEDLHIYLKMAGLRMTRSCLIAVVMGAALLVQGCIPMAIGGYIGYQIAKDNAHSDWCVQHPGDPSCHP